MLRRDEFPAVIQPERRGMAGVGPAQDLLAREIRDAGGGDELGADAGALDQGRVRPAQKAAGIVGEGCGRGEGRPDERGTPPRLQAVPDDMPTTSTVDSCGPAATR